MNGNKQTAVTYLVLTLVLFGVQLSFAQPMTPHWLVGQWEGKIEGYLPKQDPGRRLQVFEVLSDGTVRGRWSITGQSTGEADVKLDGIQVRIITSADSQVVLKRERDDSLVGAFTLKNGKRFAIALTKKNQVKSTVEEWSALEAEARAAENEGRWARASSLYRQAGRAARRRSQYQKAIEYASRSLEAGEKAKSPVQQVAAILQLVQAYRRVGQANKVGDLLVKCRELLKSIPVENTSRPNLEADVYLESGSEFIRTNELDRAIEYIGYSLQSSDTQLTVLERTPGATRQSIKRQRDQIARTLELLGDAHSRAGNIDQAATAYERGVEANKDSGVTTTAIRIHLGLGELYSRGKVDPRAAEHFQIALRFSENLRFPQGIRRASSWLGNFLRRTNKSSEAIPYYEKAIAIIESTRTALESEEFRTSFFEDKVNIYANMIRTQIEQKSWDDAFNYNERARSRTFLDVLGSKVQLARSGTLMEHERALQARISVLRAMMDGQDGDSLEAVDLRKDLAEAEKAYNEYLTTLRKENKEQASLMNVEPLTIKQVQERLDPSVTMLEYFVSANNVWLWVVEKDRVEFVNTSIARRDLVMKVTELRDTIYQFGEKDRFNALSQELHKILIEPALPHIKGKELIIVPHDLLHYLPFQTLLGTDNRYLIEKYPIYYFSSASLMQFTQEKRRAMGDKVLAFGNPDLGDPEKNLEFAELEAQEIKSAYPQSAVHLKKDATEAKAKALSPNNDIIHFATHAELKEDDPLSSAILLTKDGKEDGRLEAREIFEMNLKASLVVLSGCDTGLGKLSTGDELVGLTRAFIYAGTPSVVASLWKIDDSSTAHLMASFYKNLKTMTKVESLRQAQLQLIRGEARSDLLARRGVGGVGKLGEASKTAAQAAGPDLPASGSISISTSHPYFWAPFVLVGDGGR